MVPRDSSLDDSTVAQLLTACAVRTTTSLLDLILRAKFQSPAPPLASLPEANTEGTPKRCGLLPTATEAERDDTLGLTGVGDDVLVPSAPAVEYMHTPTRSTDATLSRLPDRDVHHGKGIEQPSQRGEPWVEDGMD